ncbi:hypothetical protein [Pseudoalteromonas sp. RB2-MNA-CIBAN-0110]
MIELQLLQGAYAKAITENVTMALVPCSGLLLEEHEFVLFT